MNEDNERSRPRRLKLKGDVQNFPNCSPQGDSKGSTSSLELHMEKILLFYRRQSCRNIFICNKLQL